MEQKLQELMDKLFKEGVEKGEAKAKEIIKEAELKAADIITRAKMQAEAATSKAVSEARDFRRNMEAELGLSGKQAISAIKQQIIDLILAKTVDAAVDRTLTNADFVGKMIQAVIQNWKPQEQEHVHLELLVPEVLRKEMESSFELAIRNLLNEGVQINFSQNIKGGFQIVSQGDGYKISLTDQDFIEFFRQYLRPKTRNFLFPNS